MALRTAVRKAVQKRGFAASHLRHLASSSNIITCPFPEIEIPTCSIPEYIFSKFGSYGNKVAFECGVTGRKYTFDELRVKSYNLNRALRKKLKLQKDDVVAVLLPNVPEFPIAVMGILLAGLRVTTMNPIYTQDEIKKQFADAGAKAMITLTELFPVVKVALTGKEIPIICINDQASSTTPTGAINFKEFADNSCDIEDIKLDDQNAVAVMPYSSGTTGLPKGVQLSHRNILANLSQFMSDDFTIMRLASGDFQEVVPAILPMFHIYGFTTICMAGMNNGGKTITLPKFTPESYLKLLAQHKATILFAVPPIVIFLYSHPAVKKELLENVHVLVSGAAPLGALDEQKFKDKIGQKVDVLQGYGLSEASPTVMMGARKHDPKPGSLGNIMPNTEVKIMPVGNPDGEALGPNQTGELYVKGPQVMLGYHNRPKETAETLVDGWLRTGDMFYYDENQTFFITDRIKELIKVKGFQVPPAELEEIIRDFPSVNDAAVIGIPHDIYGEVPRAYVVAKPDSKLDVAELNGFIDSKVAEYKRVRGGIVVTDCIPKNASGKILRRELKLQYQNGK
ncbi:PREDICTED: probable 4-coumarate--CoA ligase 3 [Nicrophorus vespilloides]|uniref:Probable 4-coumarate--CoA ligase 3 n=1 Tax=Nicrophorus vespilloides TaxID=110193 RepID=A0ABM1M0D5_NICVS|nr:PREDICTED: probable 4-coumarate--CoA ligase 3 [Nicrophorus vespilloides]